MGRKHADPSTMISSGCAHLISFYEYDKVRSNTLNRTTSNQYLNAMMRRVDIRSPVQRTPYR